MSERSQVNQGVYLRLVMVAALVVGGCSRSAGGGGDRQAPARQIEGVGEDVVDWLKSHTDYDPKYVVPIDLWRDTVGGITAGARKVVKGITTGDRSLVAAGEAAMHDGWQSVGEADLLGEWGPLLIH